MLFGAVILTPATQFRIGLANVFFMSALFENNIKKPLFNALKEPPSRIQEMESDSMNLEYLARYFNYLNADILVLWHWSSSISTTNRFRVTAQTSLSHNGSPLSK